MIKCNYQTPPHLNIACPQEIHHKINKKGEQNNIRISLHNKSTSHAIHPSPRLNKHPMFKMQVETCVCVCSTNANVQ